MCNSIHDSLQKGEIEIILQWLAMESHWSIGRASRIFVGILYAFRHTGSYCSVFLLLDVVIVRTSGFKDTLEISRMAEFSPS